MFRKKTIHSLIGALALLACHSQVWAADTLSIQDITSGKYAADNMRSLTPLADGESFAQFSQNRDQILKYSFKTGQQTGVIFDTSATKGATIKSVDSYVTSPDDRYILVATHTNRIYRRSATAEYYVYEVGSKQLTPLSANGAQQSPVWAPDSRHVAFVRDNNIYVVDIENGMRETPITTDGRRNEVINGIPDWVNEEEFGIATSMVFTADSEYLCWVRYDEKDVKTYALQLFKGLSPEKQQYAEYPGFYDYKYPKAGCDNSVVTAWSHRLSDHSSAMIPLPLPAEGYIPRIRPGISGCDVVLYTMNRHQDSLCVYSADVATRKCRLLFTETVPKYVKEEVLGNIYCSPKGALLISDRDGMMQAYLYDQDFRRVRKLTDARYGVTDIYGYDEKTQRLFYQAAGRSPMEREVYVTDKKGRTQMLTKREGWNSALFSSDYRYYVNTFSNMDTPYQCDVFNLDGKLLRSVVDNGSLREKLAQLSQPSKEMFSFTTSEGVTLNGWMVKPADFNPSKKYPVIMFQYSGPGSQQVVNSWGFGSMGQGGLYDHYFADQGFIVVCTDGRGTGGRGADFEKCTYMQLGELEARDQVETAIWLGKQAYVDADKIGIWGWSYGGFCTLMSMSEGREVFSAGVAVAPPTNWRYYDSIYTERFMRTPKENPEGYAVNPSVRAQRLHGHLLICHGLADDNVHPQNTFEYSEALVQADKDFKEIIYTNRNHSIYGANTRHHLLRQIAQFFVEHLGK